MKLQMMFVAIVLMLTTVLFAMLIGLLNSLGIDEIISQLATIVASMGTVTIAIIAYKALNTWKHQLKYGKYLNAIWEAMLALHKLEITFYEIGDKRYNIEKQLDELQQAFVLLDSIVEKNQFEWTNKYKDIERTINVIQQARSNRRTFSEDDISNYKKLPDYTEKLIHKLRDLEEKYLSNTPTKQ